MVLIGYGNYTLSFTITSSPGSSAGTSTFLTETDALADGRAGLLTTLEFDTGTAALTQYSEIGVTASSPLDTTAPWGVVGLCNVQGVPEGTKCTFNGVTQRLVADEIGQLNAWWIPNGLNSNASQPLRIYNDVNGSHSISPGATVGIGEIFVGRIIQLRDLFNSQPQDALNDPTAATTTDGGSDWEVMRKPRGTVSQKLGPFSANDVMGKSASSLVSGANPAGVIDLRTLRGIISTSRKVAVCPFPHAGQGAGSTVNGIRFDQDLMQSTWMLARPLDVGALARDMSQKWSWSPSWQQSR